MKIGIHANEFNRRGTGKVPLDYALALRNHYNHDIIMISSREEDNSGNINIPTNIEQITYKGTANNSTHRVEVKHTLERLVEKEKIDFLYMVKWGTNDQVTPSNCKTGIHCVFEMTEPHGTVYAGVSEYIAKKYTQPLFVPHIIKQLPLTVNIRQKYNIDTKYTVIGRIGGVNNFNLNFARQAVIDILKHRKDLFFLFMSTQPFLEHERVLFIPFVDTEQEKYNHIHACDAMIHARLDGETFGLACGEFSACNKPIITWSGLNHPGYDKCHLDILGKKAIIYNEYQDLLDILYSIKREDTLKRSWDVYSDKFSEKNVINQFNQVFLT